MPDEIATELARIRGLAEKALPDWSAGHLPHRDGDGYAYGGEATICIKNGPTLVVGCGSNAQNIAAFAADARTSVPRLCDALEEAWRVIDTLSRTDEPISPFSECAIEDLGGKAMTIACVMAEAARARIAAILKGQTP